MKKKIFSILMAVVLVLSLGMVFAPAQPASAANGLPPPIQVWVDDDWTGAPADGHTWGYDAFGTIANGITGVASGGIVIVHDGNYAEAAVTVNKPVTITNAPGETPVLTPITTTGFNVTVNDVTIVGFMITGCDPGVQVAAGLSNIGIFNNEITNFGAQTSLPKGIWVQGGIDGLIIVGNIISEVGPNSTTDSRAIHLDPGMYYDTVIADNLIFDTDNGLILLGVHGESDDKRVQVVNNCIYGIDPNANDALRQKGGIWLDSCEFINVADNIVTDNGHGISLSTWCEGGLLYGISIVSNYITNNLQVGIVVNGIHWDGTLGPVNWGGNIVISNNVITGNGAGAVSLPYAPGFTVVSSNVFTVDASGNWWGDATGPKDTIGSPPPGHVNPSGLGDGALVVGPPTPMYSFGGPASLIYAPWLTADPYFYPLVVDITTPVTSTEIDKEQTFSVCATITNVSDEPVAGVEAEIVLTNPLDDKCGPGAILVHHEPDVKPLGSIAPGGSQDVCWTLKCTDCGDVEITVTTTPGVCAPTKSDTVIIHQPADLKVVVDAPEKVCVSCDVWDVTATITNLGGMTTTDVVATISWDDLYAGEVDILWVSGGSSAPGHPQIISSIAPGQSVPVVWTLHCNEGVQFPTTPNTITVDVSGTDACDASGTAEVLQHSELMVTFQTPTNTVPTTTFSTEQEFEVRVDVRNCTDTSVSNINVVIDWALSSDVSYWDGTAWNWYNGTTWMIWDGTAWVSGAPPDTTQTIDTLCPCCCEPVTWLLRCEDPGSVTFTVNATGGTKCGRNSVTIDQELKAHLDAETDGFIMPTSESTFGVCEDFVVLVRVINTGTADALNVSGTLELLGVKTSLVAGETLTKTIPLIPGSNGYGTFVWKLHCDECGTEMIKVVDIGGTDENTGVAILAANIKSPTSICPLQLGLGVEIISPQTCTDFNVSDTFCVDALLTNLPSPCLQLGCGQTHLKTVFATLNIYGPAELVIGDPATKGIGIIPVGGTQEVEWTVHCTGRGDVKFTVTAAVPLGECGMEGPYYCRTSELVIVHQQKVCPIPELLTCRPVGLIQGWNLISLPLIPEDPTIGVVLDGIPFQKVAAYSPFQDWKYYNPLPAPSDLYQMNDGWGYWVDMGSAATTLDVCGYELVGPPPAVPPYYGVVVGWNLIGFKSTMPKLPVDYLAGIAGKYVVIYGFANGVYFLVGSLGHTSLLPGLGYWIAITAPGTIYP